jgi:hypothetical protein
MSTSCGAAGTSMVFATASVLRSITATLFADETAITSHLPSGVGAEP